MAALENIRRIIDKFVTPLYKPLFVLYVLTTFFTFMISYTESKGSNYFVSIVNLIPDKFYLFLYSNRYQITLLFFFVLAFCWDKKRKNCEKSCKCIDEFQRELGGIISTIIKNNSGLDDNNKSNTEYDILSNDILEFLNRFTNHICKVFSSYTGKNCHVSIKTLNNGTVTSWVREYYMSEASRSSIDEALPSFDYKKNTAFSKIIDNDDACFYLNNWLKISSMFAKYDNVNPSWKNIYDSTLVVPITLKTHPKKINQDNVWGFICVDNKGGGFDKTSAWILYSFARVCFNVFDCVPIVNKTE